MSMPEQKNAVQTGVKNLRDVWRTYAFWSLWVGIAFFGVYPTCNYLSAQRADIHHFYLPQELDIPFVPEFFWVYVSMYVLFLFPPFFLSAGQLVTLGKRIIVGTFISAVLFLLFPSTLGFERVMPEGFYAPIYARIFSVDLPYNMAPSLHVVYTAFILLAIRAASQKRAVRAMSLLWLAMIVLSTLLVHQHHLIDVLSALTIVWLVTHKLVKRSENG